MNDRTRKMNQSCARAQFWNRIKLHADSFAGMLDPIEQLMPDDRSALQEVHYLLYQSMKLAQSREAYHRHKLQEAFA